MEVVLEPQTQLVSRIGLVIKNSTQLSFLHGKTGVGKSHVAHLVQHAVQNTHVVKIQLKKVLEPEQLKQQIMCELATDELLDLNQPIATAVFNSIVQNNQSVLLIIDNAELIPQQMLSALWQSVHELTRMNQSRCTFNILLIGESSWAIPMHHGLNNKPDSLVAEFEVLALTKHQASDFMMSIHTDWSDQKIQQFVNKIAPEYLIPKQLIYAQLPQNNAVKRKIIVFVGAIVISLCILTVIVGYLIAKDKERSSSVNRDIAQVIQPALATEVVQSENDKIQIEKINKAPAEQKEQPRNLLNEETSQEIEDNVELLTSDITSVPEDALIVAKEVDAAKPTKTLVEEVEIKAVVIKAQVSSFIFDEEYLLNLPQASYALMLGGFSSEATLSSVKGRFEQPQQLKMYKTIRYGTNWFVLLYGSFDTLAQANQFVKENASQFEGFSPWAKSYRAIQQEINTNQLPENNKKEDND